MDRRGTRIAFGFTLAPCRRASRPRPPFFRRLAYTSASRVHYSTKMSADTPKRALLWFRNDLRLHDNHALAEAFKYSNGAVIPLYCFDPDTYGKTVHGRFPKTGYLRARFLVESAEDLRARLRDAGSDLIISRGRPQDVIPELADKLNARAVFCQREVTQEESDVEKKVEQALGSGGALRLLEGSSTLYYREDVPDGIEQLPDTFTQFRKNVESSMLEVERPLSPPEGLHSLPEDVDVGELPDAAELSGEEAISRDNRAALEFRGGEGAALERLNYYLWKSDTITRYKEIRNGLLGGDYSTKFSPYLASGCLSPRQVYHEVRRYEKERTANQSTYWVIFELMWRDYFRFVALKYGNNIFKLTGPMHKTLEWSTNRAKLQQWMRGDTGFPFVDANMRELDKTGWMSNRGRQNVASFLTKDLKIDWRLGAEWFESRLLDYDPCSNYGNWTYTAGVGNDPRQDRHFNVIKQAKNYDGQGDYTKTWVPELKSLPVDTVHEPFRAQPEKLQEYGVELGRDYPKPMLENYVGGPLVPGSKPTPSQPRKGKGKGKGGQKGKGGKGGQK